MTITVPPETTVGNTVNGESALARARPSRSSVASGEVLKPLVGSGTRNEIAAVVSGGIGKPPKAAKG